MSDVVIALRNRNGDELDAPWYFRQEVKVVGALTRPYLLAQWCLPSLRPRTELLNQVGAISGILVYVNDVPVQEIDLTTAQYDLLTVFPENTLNVYVPLALLES